MVLTLPDRDKSDMRCGLRHQIETGGQSRAVRGIAITTSQHQVEVATIHRKGDDNK